MRAVLAARYSWLTAFDPFLGRIPVATARGALVPVSMDVSYQREKDKESLENDRDQHCSARGGSVLLARPKKQQISVSFRMCTLKPVLYDHENAALFANAYARRSEAKLALTALTYRDSMIRGLMEVFLVL
jgi:hypothetical protein